MPILGDFGSRSRGRATAHDFFSCGLVRNAFEAVQHSGLLLVLRRRRNAKNKQR